MKSLHGVPNVMLIGPYWGIFGPKDTKIAKFANFVAVQRQLPLFSSHEICGSMYASVLCVNVSN